MTVMVLGAGGMLGHKIYSALKSHFKTIAVLRGDLKRYSYLSLFDPKLTADNTDVSDDKVRENLLREHGPQWVINCVGMTTRKISGDHAAQVIKINSLLPHQLAEWCQSNGARLIHFSTDCVFSGHKGGYTEDDLPDARDLYGLSKLLGEVSHSPAALTIRSSIIGREIAHFTELVEWFISQAGKSAKGYSKVYYSGVTTNYMAELVWSVLHSKNPPMGLYHLASPKISKYDLLSLINQHLDLGVNLTPDESKISDKSMIGIRLFQTLKDVDKPRWETMIPELAKEHETYRRWVRECPQR